MNEHNREKELTELRIGDFIFLIWIIASLLGLSSNLIEENCINTNTKENMKLVDNLRIVAMYIGLIIYLYFFIKAYYNLKENAYNPHVQKAINAKIKFITSILFLISSLLLLYIEKHSTKNESDLII